jgi:hypothetical protein
MVGSFLLAKIMLGDALFVLLLACFSASMAWRFTKRNDIPPPGFTLILMSFICAAAGSIMAIVQAGNDPDMFRFTLQKLLSYQGFILLPILGVGPFLLPRFFRKPSTHNFPESRHPPKGWWPKALSALAAGLLIIISFFLEADGWTRSGHALRFLVTLAYLAREIPLRSAPDKPRILGLLLRLALLGLLAGFLAVSIFPAYRVSLLHLTLIGGFSVITFTVATRVVFGHSGNLPLLRAHNRWLFIAVGLMLFGMATRISGDFWPRIMASHYIYGALCWIAGALLWACYVLPKVLLLDPDDSP